ncbi:MAG: (2Fe-2S) ferredoxin domain-containing protein [Pseudanabaenales cyanobacterium]|nr:(2Fe-2S) ferredoxin domain-containing protein [Pseudanabaenales cyanobacterium]
MTKFKAKLTEPFSLEGRFIGFAPDKKSPFKYLLLATANGDYLIKLPKYLRIDVIRCFTPGDWIFVSGKQKVKLKTGEIWLKADNIIQASPGQFQEILPAIALKTAPATAKSFQRSSASKATKAKVLVCNKSSCMKRGGKAICKLLESELREQGLTDQISIQLTGCMGHCKVGPNLVFMPDKARYRRVSPKMIPDLISKHFCAPDLYK